MSNKRIQQLANIRKEYDASRSTLEYTIRHWAELVNANEFQGQTLKDFRFARQNVEVTYLIRLFSQFEAVLRDFLREQGRRIPRVTEVLINRVASMQQIPAPLLAQVHNVRLYRNRLVHDGAQPTLAVDFGEALAALNRFVAWLPEPP